MSKKPEKPTVNIEMTNFEHPDSVRIEITIDGADAETRKRTSDVIVGFVKQLREADDV